MHLIRKTKLCAICLPALWAVGLYALPTMPPDFKIIREDASGKTWRETGELKMPLAMGLVTLRSSMRTQGYALKHDIFDKKSPTSHILLWIKGEEEIIMSVWEKTLSTTGCSWGLSLKEGQGQSDNNKAAKTAVQPQDATAKTVVQTQDATAETAVQAKAETNNDQRK